MANYVLQSGSAVNITGNGPVAPSDSGCLVGVLCSTSSGGTLTLQDGRGRVICNNMPMTAGQFYPMPFEYQKGLTATVGGTLDATLSIN